MAERRPIGLEYIKIGDIEVDGGMSTALSILGVTYQDTAELVTADPDVTEIFSEENVDPEEELVEMGARSINWSIMNFEPDELIRLFGGTKSGTAPNEKWEAPTTYTPVEQSVEFKTANGMVVQMPRVKLTPKINWQMRKKGVGLIDIAGKVLTPTKAATAPISIDKPAS